MNENMEKDKYKELKDAGLTATSAAIGAIGSTEVVGKIMAEDEKQSPPEIQEQEVKVIISDIDFHQQEIDEMCVVYGGPSDIYPDIGEYIIVDDVLDMYGPDPSILTDSENEGNEIVLMDYEISSVDGIVILNESSSETEDSDLQDSDDMDPYMV